MAVRKNIYIADDGSEHNTLKEATQQDRGLKAARYIGDIFQKFPSGITPMRAKDISDNLVNIFKGK